MIVFVKIDGNGYENLRAKKTIYNLRSLHFKAINVENLKKTIYDSVKTCLIPHLLLCILAELIATAITV